MKRPAFQFYPSDWRKDMALQSCSVAARGLWIDMLCIAHECEPYGHMVVNGKPMTIAQIGRHSGLTARECEKLIEELDAAGVPSRTSEGVIFSRRMVRDEELRNARAEGGKAGSEHGIKGADHGSKGGRPKKVRGVSKPPLEPPLEPPPSSSSSASAVIPSEANASAAAASPMSAKDRLWALGVSLLGEKARAFIGKIVATYTEPLVLDVLQEAAREQPGDAKAWVVAACEARAKRMPGKVNGHDQGDLLSDPTPKWALDAGFRNRFEAENALCFAHNAAQFRDGRRSA